MWSSIKLIKLVLTTINVITVLSVVYCNPLFTPLLSQVPLPISSVPPQLPPHLLQYPFIPRSFVLPFSACLPSNSSDSSHKQLIISLCCVLYHHCCLLFIICSKIPDPYAIQNYGICMIHLHLNLSYQRKLRWAILTCIHILTYTYTLSSRLFPSSVVLLNHPNSFRFSFPTFPSLLPPALSVLRSQFQVSLQETFHLIFCLALCLLWSSWYLLLTSFVRLHIIFPSSLLSTWHVHTTSSFLYVLFFDWCSY